MKRSIALLLGAALTVGGLVAVASSASASNTCGGMASVDGNSLYVRGSIYDSNGCGSAKIQVRYWIAGQPVWTVFPLATAAIPAGSFLWDQHTVSNNTGQAYRACTAETGVPVPCSLSAWKTNKLATSNF